jgi:arylsulfatase A-like enzyme
VTKDKGTIKMLNRRNFLQAAGITALSLSATSLFAKPKKQPNILWISTEDISPHLGCYGDPHAKTPTLDKLAREGIRFSNVFTVAGVCAPNRSSIITGVYQTTLGTHHMRSGGEGVERSIKPVPPPFIKCFPEYLRNAGYYCTNNAKQDYQFIAPDSAWDESSRQAHWKNRPNKDKPFFAVFNYNGTHEGSVRLTDEAHAERTKRLKPDQRQNPDTMTTLPPYYPDTPAVRKRWAHYYELITVFDYVAADLLQELEDEGVADNTIVFFWSDHGVGLPRAKRWLYDSGTHVPLIVRIPEKYRNKKQGIPGTVDDQVVSSVDFAPTVLNLTDLPVPDYMQGRAFLGDDLSSPRKYAFGSRDRMDDRYDIIRMVRDKKYRYIRNYEPFKEYYQYMNTSEKSMVMRELRKLKKEGKSKGAVATFLADTKPLEELYDLEQDPHEITNLAANPSYRSILIRMSQAHSEWMLRTKDLGLVPEPELVRLDNELGTRYAIFRQSNGDKFLKDLLAIASVAGKPDRKDLGILKLAMEHDFPAVRYWGAIGLGNLMQDAGPALNLLNQKLTDFSAVVRVASARALLKLDHENSAIPLLISELQSPHEWVRLYAAIVLDRAGEQARPAIPAMKQALLDRENKYVVRVVNHALNTLLGTNNQVR